VDLLRGIDELSLLPSQRLDQLQACMNGIIECAQQEQGAAVANSLAADDLLPIFIYVVAHANLRHHHSTLTFLLHTTPRHVMTTQTGYALTMLESAIFFILNLEGPWDEAQKAIRVRNGRLKSDASNGAACSTGSISIALNMVDLGGGGSSVPKRVPNRDLRLDQKLDNTLPSLAEELQRLERAGGLEGGAADDILDRLRGEFKRIVSDVAASKARVEQLVSARASTQDILKRTHVAALEALWGVEASGFESLSKASQLAAGLFPGMQHGMRTCKQKRSLLLHVWEDARNARGAFEEFAAKIENKTNRGTGDVDSAVVFAEDAAAAAIVTGGRVVLQNGELKHLFRAFEKTCFQANKGERYNGAYVVDFVRCRFSCDSFLEMERVLQCVMTSKSCRVTRVKDRINHPTATGWSDVIVNLTLTDDPSYHVCEIQIVNKSMLDLQQILGLCREHVRFRSALEVLQVAIEKPPLGAKARGKGEANRASQK
jgi:hypothetical protein